MKLLTEYESSSEADNASLRLETKGIATYVSNRHAGEFTFGMGGPIGVGLWVVLDNQYEDAMALLINPDHSVTNALSPGEIEIIRKDIHSADGSRTFETIAWMCGWLLLFVVVVYLITGLE